MRLNEPGRLNDRAQGLLDEAIKQLSETWRPQDVEQLMRSRVACTMLEWAADLVADAVRKRHGGDYRYMAAVEGDVEEMWSIMRDIAGVSRKQYATMAGWKDEMVRAALRAIAGAGFQQSEDIARAKLSDGHHGTPPAEVDPEAADPWAETDRLIREQSVPYDYGTLDLKPSEVVDGQLYEILIGTGATGWHSAHPRGRKWYTPDGVFMTYADPVKHIRIPEETMRNEIVGARNLFEKRAWETKDDVAADQEALDKVRSAAERLTKPRTAARGKLTLHLESEYRRSTRDILTPGFVQREAELKKQGL